MKKCVGVSWVDECVEESREREKKRKKKKKWYVLEWEWMNSRSLIFWCVLVKKKSIIKNKKLKLRNATIIFSQWILSGGLLLVNTNEKKNLSGVFKLKSVTTYHVWFVVKIL